MVSKEGGEKKIHRHSMSKTNRTAVVESEKKKVKQCEVQWCPNRSGPQVKVEV